METTTDLLSCFKNLVTTEDEIYSDITVVVAGKIFPCHRFILSSCSPYFRGLIRSDMQNKKQNINLRKISSEAFKIIYGFIYLNENGLTEENILEVWKATDFLQIDIIVLECRNFAIGTINERNYRKYFWFAEFHDKDFMAKILEHITFNFDQFKDSECVMELEGEKLMSIVRDPNLKTSREENVVETILKWVSHISGDRYLPEDTVKPDGDKISRQLKSTDKLRADYLVPMLSRSRLTSLDISYLGSLWNHHLIKNNRGANLLILNVNLYSSQSTYWPTYACHRKCNQWVDAVLMTSRSKFITVFHLLEKKILGDLELSALPHGAALFVYRENIYACGYTTNNNKSLTIFKFYYGIWGHGAKLEVSDNISPQESEFQAGHQTLLPFVIQNSVYVVHFNSGTIFTWNVMWSRCLKQLTIVPSGMRVTHVTVYKSLIIFIRGTQSSSAKLNVYDTTRLEWRDPVPLGGVCIQSMTSFYKEEELYIIASDGKLHVVETVGDRINLRHVATVSNFSYTLVGALVYFEELLLFVRDHAVTSIHEIVPKGVEFDELFNQVHVIGTPHQCTSLVSTSLSPKAQNMINQ